MSACQENEQMFGQQHAKSRAGEVHLETCIKDLRERFARIELQVSPPLVAFRESTFCAAEALDQVAEPPKVSNLSPQIAAQRFRSIPWAVPCLLFPSCPFMSIEDYITAVLVPNVTFHVLVPDLGCAPLLASCMIRWPSQSR